MVSIACSDRFARAVVIQRIVDNPLFPHTENVASCAADDLSDIDCVESRCQERGHSLELAGNRSGHALNTCDYAMDVPKRLH